MHETTNINENVQRIMKDAGHYKRDNYEDAYRSNLTVMPRQIKYSGELHVRSRVREFS